MPLRLPCATPRLRCSGPKYIWDNRVSTLPPRVPNQPRKISPRGLVMSSGCDGASQRRVRRQGVHDRSGPLAGAHAQRVERRRHRRDDRTGPRVRQAHVQPGQRRRLGFPEDEREEICRRAAAAPYTRAHPGTPPGEPLTDAPLERILTPDEDVVAPERVRGLVTRGRRAAERPSVTRRYDA